MSTLTENEGMLVALQEQEVDPKKEKFTSHIGESNFLWKLLVNTQPVSPGRWRVQMVMQSDSNPIRNFASSSLEVGFNEPAKITFPIALLEAAFNKYHQPDEFWVERFESVGNAISNQRENNEPGQPEVHFRLVPNTTGTKPASIIIENMSMTIFWIIGARNISLTEIS